MRALIALAFLAVELVAQTAEPEAKSSIRGVVTDSNGLPLSGVVVRAYRDGEPLTLRMGHNSMVMMSSGLARATTDEAGKYALTNLSPATYSLKTERDPESSTYRRIKVEAAQDVTLDIVVPANPEISGHVLDQNGDPQVDTQTVRWNVPEDLEKVLLAMLQAKSVDATPKAKLEVTVEAVPIS
jgi:hypothetical protein